MKKYFIFFFLIVSTSLAQAQPDNDDCASAENITISTSETTVNFAIVDAALNNEVGCEGTTDDYGDIWYEFTMPSDGNLYINSPYIVNNFALYESCSGMQLQCDFGNPFFTNLLSGTNYKLRVFRSAEYLSSTGLSFGIRVMEKPTNDDCSTAQTLNVSFNEADVEFNVFGASLNNEDGCSGTTQDYLDIWYEFTMPIDGKFVMSDAYTLDTFALYDDCSGTQIQCGELTQFSGLIAGTNYKLRLMNELITLNGITGNYDFSYNIVSSSANDTCNTAETITVTTGITTVDYDIDTATIEASEFMCFNGIYNITLDEIADIWFDFTMPVDGSIRIDTAFGNDNFHELYTSCDEEPLNCDPDDFIFRNLSAGTNYKLRLVREADDLFEDFWDQTFDISAIEIGANNECSNSENIVVSSTPLEIVAHFGASTFSSDNGCSNSSTNDYVDLWYNFEMPIDGIVQINRFNTGNGNFFTLYDSCDGTEIGCFSNQGNFTDLTMGTNYTLRFFDDNWFINNVDFTIEVTDALGVNDQNLETSISMYPNPASEFINIALSDSQTIIAIDCYDVFGKKVLKTTQNEQMDVSSLQSGLYFIKIKTDLGSVTKKIIVQ